MHCPSCGKPLSKQTKYCNSCGAQLIAVVQSSKERLDEYLTGLFWITVIGLGLILGGLILMQKFQLNYGLMVAFLTISSVAFIINFWLNLAETLRIIKGRREEEVVPAGPLNTNELSPGESSLALESAPSVTENTTRTLEPASRERVR